MEFTENRHIVPIRLIASQKSDFQISRSEPDLYRHRRVSFSGPTLVFPERSSMGFVSQTTQTNYIP